MPRLPLLSSPPMRVCVGADSIPRGEPGAVGKFTGYSPTGYPWLIFHGSKAGSLQGYGSGLDASGTWWMGFGPLGYAEITPKDAPNTLDIVNGFVTDTVVPVLSSILVVFAPGIGIPFAAALDAWRKLAKGAKIDKVLIDAAQNQLAGVVDSKAFTAGKEVIQKLGGSTAIQAARNVYSSDPDLQKSFEQGLTLAQAQIVQQSAVASFTNSMPTDRKALFQSALDRGAEVRDLAFALDGGLGGVGRLNERVNLAVIKEQARVGSGPTGTGSKSSGGSGIGLGTLAVLGGGGYLAVKFGPAIFSSIFNHRPKMR